MVATAVNQMKPAGIADIAKGQVHMPDGHLKHLGETGVEVVLRPGLSAKVVVEVVSEGEEGAASDGSSADKLKDAVFGGGGVGGRGIKEVRREEKQAGRR